MYTWTEKDLMKHRYYIRTGGTPTTARFACPPLSLRPHSPLKTTRIETPLQRDKNPVLISAGKAPDDRGDESEKREYVMQKPTQLFNLPIPEVSHTRCCLSVQTFYLPFTLTLPLPLYIFSSKTDSCPYKRLGTSR